MFIQPQALQELFHYLQVMTGAVFIYHAFQVHRLSKAYPFVPYTGLVPMSLSAAAYYLLFECYRLELSPVEIRILAHLVWTSGALFIYFHIVALEAYANSRSRWITFAKRLVMGSVTLGVLSLISLLLFDQMLMLSEEPMVNGPPVFPERVKQAFSMNAFGDLITSCLGLAEIASFGYFLRLLISKKADRWLILGLGLTLFAILNDVLVAMNLNPVGVSFLFIASIVEIIRLTVLIERANRQRFLSLEHSARLSQMGELAATVVHELGAPLTVVMAHTEMRLKKQLQGPEDPQSYKRTLVQIQQAAQKMIEIVRTLRNYAGKSEPVIVPFDIAQTVQDTIQLVGSLYAEEKILLDLQLEENLPRAQGDPQRFQQVLINLLQNARDATKDQKDRRIQITAALIEAKIRIRVTDNGSGIPQEILDQVFTPFFTTKPRGEGTGIGLSYVVSQLKIMRGKIEVRSRPEEGTTFEILLPAMPRSSAL